MGFGKAIGYGILIFLGINVLIGFLNLVLLGIDPITSGAGNVAYRFHSFFSSFGTSPLTMPFYLLSGFMFTLYGLEYHLAQIYGDYIAATGMYTGAYIAMLVPIISIALYCVAAALIGYFAKDPLKGFAAWFLISFIGYSFAILASTIPSPQAAPLLIIQTFQFMVVNGLAYGAIAMGFGYKFEE